MLTVEEAQAKILSAVSSAPPVPFSIENSLGLTLAEDIVADIDNPPFDNSAVDGYAVIADDTSNATSENTIYLNPIDVVFAGDNPSLAITNGQCCRVMTGAPMPTGADSMIMIEDTTLQPNGTIAINTATIVGDYVRKRANDIHVGEVVIEAGKSIQPADVAAMAALGYSTVSCHPFPKVVVFSSGDELVEIDQFPSFGKIRDANRYAIAALIKESGAEALFHEKLPDNLDHTIERLSFASRSGANIVITTGGVSVGDKDFIKPAIEHLGSLELWRVAMRPGKPLAFGMIGDTLVFGLPGNPVSAQVTFELFVRPVIRKWMGNKRLHRQKVQAALSDNLERTPGRQEYIRCSLYRSPFGYTADIARSQSSGAFKSMIGANGLIIVDAEKSFLAKNEIVDVLLLEDHIA